MLAQERFEDEATASDDYASRFSGPAGAWLLDRQTNILLRLLNYLEIYPPKKVLDVGGGHGQIAVPLCARGYKVTVQGSSDECCSSRIKPLLVSQRCEYQTSHPLALPFPDNSFEVVTCFRFLPHIEDWKKLIAELCRVSSRAVIVDYPPLFSFNLFYPLLFKLKKKLEGNTRPFTLFKHAEIDAAFEGQGFCKEIARGEFFWPMVVHRGLGQPAASKIIETLPRTVGLCDSFGSPVIALFVKQ